MRNKCNHAVQTDLYQYDEWMVQDITDKNLNGG